MNPFDLPGPAFLVFYLVFGVLTALAVWRLRRTAESVSVPPLLTDYLDIAFLRGGATEAVRVAIVTLVDRGLLAIVGKDRVKASVSDAVRRVSKGTERSILTKCAKATETTTLFSDSALTLAATSECEPTLKHWGLLPSDDARVVRFRLFLLAATLLVTVAAIKVAVALARGRTNIGFLILETLLFVAVAGAATHPTRTPAGNIAVEDLKTLFAGVKQRSASVRPRRGGSDFALLAAVFGVGAVLPFRPDAKGLFPRAKASSSGGSCGGSCGSSCGSSCGGGSCGGGCGGCGGD